MDGMRQGQKMHVTSRPGPPSTNDGQEVYCPICGRDGDPGLKRFGHMFCSEAHVAQYASERPAKADVVKPGPTALAAKTNEAEGTQAMTCGIGTKGGLRKMGWCVAGGVGLLIGLPLIASGGLAAAAGSLLTVAAALACPIGMYFMMRGMMKMQGKEPPNDSEKQK